MYCSHWQLLPSTPPASIQHLEHIREGILSSLFMEYLEHWEHTWYMGVPNKYVEWMNEWIPTDN